MVSFVAPASGGIQPINGVAGSIIEDMATASRSQPGKGFIPHSLNVIEAAKNIAMPMSNCDPQAQKQKMEQQVQQQIKQILEQRITQNIQDAMKQSTSLENIQKQLQSLQQPQGQTQTQGVTQQIQALEKERENQIKTLIVGAVGKASQQLPQAAKVAVVDSVTESLRTFVPTKFLDTSKLGGQKVIQTVSQGCFL